MQNPSLRVINWIKLEVSFVLFDLPISFMTCKSPSAIIVGCFILNNFFKLGWISPKLKNFLPLTKYI